MKNYKKFLGKEWVLMTDGVQLFNNGVFIAMDRIRLWDSMIQCYKLTYDGIDYFISIGGNASYFKTDGQKYCVQLHIAKDEDCYMETCFCTWTQNEIQPKIEYCKSLVHFMIECKNDFEKSFEKAQENYKWQTSKV